MADVDEVSGCSASAAHSTGRGVHHAGYSGSRCQRKILLKVDVRFLCKSIPRLTRSTLSVQVSLLAGTKFPSPLEPLADTLLKHFGPQLLRAIILSAGSEGPRSVIPNLAELLAGFVSRVPGLEMGQWMDVILAEEGFPDRRATPAAKARLKEVVIK